MKGGRVDVYISQTQYILSLSSSHIHLVSVGKYFVQPEPKLVRKKYR